MTAEDLAVLNSTGVNRGRYAVVAGSTGQRRLVEQTVFFARAEFAASNIENIQPIIYEVIDGTWRDIPSI